MNYVYIGNNPAFDTVYGIVSGNYYTDDSGNVFDDSGGSMVMVGNLSQVQNAGLVPGASTPFDSTSATVAAAAAGDTSALSWVSALPQILAGVNALELSQINMQRGKQGLPPLNPSVYGPQVSVGLSQNTLMMVGGAILVGFLLLRK